MIIGIGGVSRSGKSFLAEELKKLLENKGKTVCVLTQDDFVFPEEEIQLIRDHIDWEIPESIDWEHYEKLITKAGKNYDYVFVEGLMVYWNSNLFTKFDYKLFIRLSRKEFFQRKQTDLRWGKEPDWYNEHIWESFLKFGQFPDGQTPDLTLEGEKNFDIQKIFQRIISP